MKNVANKVLILIVLVWTQFTLAQDVQELYDEAKSALLNGDYQTALVRVSTARAQIESNPNLDPNGAFKDRLLPKIANAANSMANIVQALEALYISSQSALEFPELTPSIESVNAYTRQARDASEQLLTKRDSIIAAFELDSEFQTGVRNSPVFKQIEQFASVGIVDRLSANFTRIFLVLSDSIKSINSKYATLAANVEKMKKTARANKAERQKLEDQLAVLSKERLSYMNAISEILVGEAIPENQEIRMVLTEQNLDTVFSNVILSEIQRIETVGPVDSVAFKEMLSNYERIKNYNQIFARNAITADQSDLLARYEAAIRNVQVVQPSVSKYILYGAFAVFAVIIIFALVKVIGARKKTTPTDAPPEQTDTEPKN